MRYSGRDFTEKELAWIRQLIEDRPEISRKDISIISRSLRLPAKKSVGLSQMAV